VDPRTRIVQEVAREWRAADKLPAPPDATGSEDERAFWAEVERRMLAVGLDPFAPSRT
jgi:hypothetical protein